MKTQFLMIILALGAGCSSGSSTHSTGKNGGGPGGGPQTGSPEGGSPSTIPPIDTEAEPADEPTVVTGAFLAAFGPTASQADKVQAGEKAIGVALYEKAGTKVEAFVAVASVKYFVEGDPAPHEAKVLPRSATADWHAVAVVPDADAGKIVKIEVVAHVDDAAPVDVHPEQVVKFDPEQPTPSPEGGPAKPDFSNVADPAATAPAPLTEHLLFVTDGRYAPGKELTAGGKTFASVRQANRLCNREARGEPELAAFWWKAVLSDEEADARQRIHVRGPVKSIGGQVFAADAAELFAAPAGDTLLYRNYAVATSLGDDFVQTGTAADGTLDPGNHCGNWASAEATAAVGDPGAGAKWLKARAAACAPRRLYCINYKKR